MSTSSITTVITDAGFSLLRAAPGHKLIYTRAVCGSGYVEKTQLATQTEVTDYVMDLSIVEFGPTESAATLRLQLDNSKAPKEFQLYQIGIFAKLLDEEQELIGETLIQIMQYEEPDIVRAVPHVSEFVVNVLLGQAEKVEGIIDMAAYVSLRHFSSRTVNGKPLSADVTLTGEDINVSDSDPTTVKAALSNKADLVGGEVPLSQLPQLHQNVVLYVNASTGNDDNSGTKELPFATIQAALNSLPKNLSGYSVEIMIAPGTYPSFTVEGFYGGGRFYAPSMSLKQDGESAPVVDGAVLIYGVLASVYIYGLKFPKGISSYIVTELFMQNIEVEGNTDGYGIRALSTTNLSVYNSSVSNAAVSAVTIAHGTGYIYNLGGSGNACAVSSGDTSNGGPALAVTSRIQAEATTKYIKLYGGAIIEDGVTV